MSTNTANRGYQLPSPANFLDEDVLRLISALQAIDADVASILTSLIGKAAAAHGHVINDVAGLQQALDGKQAVGVSGSLGSLSDVSDVAPANNMFLRFSGAEWAPATFDASMIAGGTINIARLPSHLASTALSSTYAPLSHSHGIAQVTGLQGAIDGKANIDHTHTAGQVSGLGSAATQNVGTAANNVVQLDGSARLPAVDASLLTNLPAGTPTGSVIAFAGASAPSDWLFCFGQNVSRTTYAALFAVLGTTYGAGDGSTTFTLPDLRGRVVAGQDDMGGVSANRLTGQTGGVDGDVLGATGGSETHTLTIAQMPSHSHTITGNATTGGSSFVSVTAGTTSLSPSTNSTGGGGAHNNVQPTIVLNYIIKT